MEKKLKLGIGALVLSVMTSSAAYAQGPSVSVGGYLDAYFAHTSQRKAFATNQFDGKDKLVTNTKIDFTVKGKSDNGLEYGAFVELEADSNAKKYDATSPNKSLRNAKEVYLFTQNNFGRLEVGSTSGPIDKMNVGAESFARASGGIYGNFSHFINVAEPNSTGFPSQSAAVYMLTPDLPTTYDGYAAKANKISYYTPEVNGFQVGFAYTPDQDNRGDKDGLTSRKALAKNCFTGGAADATLPIGGCGGVVDALDLAVKYTGQFNEVGFAAGINGEMGKRKYEAGFPANQRVRNLQAYRGGVNFTYHGFTLGGALGTWNKTGHLKTTDGTKKATYWNAGLGYVTGPVGVSLTHFSSNYSKNRFQNTVLGLDYQLAPGFMPYIEGAMFKSKQNKAFPNVGNNKGNLVMIGTKLSF